MILLNKVVELEEIIGYTFKDKNYLINAITHSSYTNENKDTEDNERLEFLGDAILNFVSAEIIYNNYSSLNEGEMTKFRANIVCETSLLSCANRLKIGDYILLGKGEARNGMKSRNSILSDAFEALIGAIYLDGGIDETKKFIKAQISAVIENFMNGIIFLDYKTRLQEIIQKNGKNNITYETIRETGPDHSKLFEVQVRIDGEVLGKGSGKNKKEAEQTAAKEALEKRWTWE